MVGVERRIVGAVLVGGAWVLGGCGGASPDPEATPSATAEPSAPESLTPAPTPSAPAIAQPERPADMDRTDEVGAAAAAEYFLILYSYVMQTGDLVEWDAMSTTACDFCAGIRGDAGKIASGGGSYAGGEIAVSDLVVGARDEAIDAFPVKSSIRQKPSQQTDAAGALVAESVGRSGEVLVEVINRPEGWGILAVVSEEA